MEAPSWVENSRDILIESVLFAIQCLSRLERQRGNCNSQQHRNYRIHRLTGTCHDFRAFAYKGLTTD
jgi:hypothetical protein